MATKPDGERTIKLCEQFIELRRRRDSLKHELSEVNGEAADLEGTIVDAFTARNVQSMKVAGHTIYLNRMVTAKAVGGDKGAMIEALESSKDTSWLVTRTANANSVSAWVRDLEPDPRTLMPKLPEHLAGVIEVNEFISARIKKGG